MKKAKVTIIFPMAGRGARFGYKFKPFLKIRDKTFIERAVESFSSSLNEIKETVFIFLKEQEDEFNVSQRLKEMFLSIKHRVIILDNPTNSHGETASKGIKQGNISGNIILCDCDHYLDASPLFAYLKNNPDKDACIIPLWRIEEKEVNSWAVASVDSEMKVLSIAEKKFPDKKGEYYGVIGCYYFSNANDVRSETRTSISASIQLLLEKKENIKGVQIKNAEFFGDPERLQKVLEERKAHNNL